MSRPHMAGDALVETRLLYRRMRLFFLMAITPLNFVNTDPIGACSSLKAEMHRRQIAERGETSNAAYDALALSNTKHAPYLRIEGTQAVVLVGLGGVTGITGDLIHPMTYSTDASIIHWIDTIWVEDQAGDVIGMRRLSPNETSPAAFAIPVPKGSVALTPYQHCNKHGLFKGPTVVIDSRQTVDPPTPLCNISNCAGWANDVDQACISEVVEYDRLYQKEFSRTMPVDGNTNLKHKPALRVNSDGTATVTVGLDNVDGSGVITYHPMSPSDDPSVVHWINAIWVKDQTDTIIAMHEFLATDPKPATFTFTIPQGTTKLVAFEYCNKHGLFQGDDTTISTAQASSNNAEQCEITKCAPTIPRYARQTDCNSMVAEAKRKQTSLNGVSASSALAFPLPHTTCDANKKHCPYIILNGTIASVVVGIGATPNNSGQPIHPMTDDPSSYGANLHFIESIWVEDQNGDVLTFRHLSPSEPSPATLYFDVPAGTTTLTSYEFCNKHGLFQGHTVNVVAGNVKFGARSGCSVQQCLEGSSITACQAFTSEFNRITGPNAKDDPTGKHKPYIMVSGTTATIVVGLGATPGNAGSPIHPMSPSDDENIVHWIQYVFARDDLNNLVALCELLPTDPAPATCTFEIPPGVIFLRPFEFCNKHGLYVGSTHIVTSSNPSAQRVCDVRECTEGMPSVSMTAIESDAVKDLLQQIQGSSDRISTDNMCIRHQAVFMIENSQVDAALRQQIDDFVVGTPPLSNDDVQRRMSTYPGLFANLKSKGGQWYARQIVLNHTGLDNHTWRDDLINGAKTSFAVSLIPAGQDYFVEGLDNAITPTQEMLAIAASFSMDWGYASTEELGPHFTIFYEADFVAEQIHVALCAKTKGWMGVGWLDPYHTGHAMNHTDITVAFMDSNGIARVQDRFAFSIEEPMLDTDRVGERIVNGVWSNGENDLMLRMGNLGMHGEEWCPDSNCDPGFTIVQFTRNFVTPDKSDVKIPARETKLKMIHAFATTDPTSSEMIQHVMSTTGYKDIPWNLDCDPGYYFDIRTIECIACDKGTFRPAVWQGTSCPSCPAGTYQDATGQSACKECKAGFSTRGPGTTTERGCLCGGPSLEFEDGQYHVNTCAEGDSLLDRCGWLGECTACPDGMTCTGWRSLKLPAPQTALDSVASFCASFAFSATENCSSATYCNSILEDPYCEHTLPILKKGYWTAQTLPPYRVFRCHATMRETRKSEVCPGGHPGADYCAKGTIGRSCSLCPEDYSLPLLKNEADCEACSGPEYIPALMVLCCACIVLSFVYIFANARLQSFETGTLVIGIAASNLFGVLVSMAVLQGLTLNMNVDLEGSMASVGLLLFNTISFRIQCFGISQGLGTWSVSLMVPLFVPFYLFFARLVTACACCKGKMLSIPKIFNTIGHIMMAIFVPLTFTAIVPFACYENPASEGQKVLSTLVTYPHVICLSGVDGKWSSDYENFFIFGMLCLMFYTLGFFTFVLFASLRAPKASLTNKDFKIYFRFMLYRFKSDRYYWGVVILIRSFCISLTPMISPSNPYAQLVVLSVVLASALSLQSTFQPWRTFQLNRVDTLSLIVFLILAVLCFTYAETPADLQQQNNENAARASFILVGVLVFYVGQVITRCVYSIFCGGELQNYQQAPDWVKRCFSGLSSGGANNRLKRRTEEAAAAFKMLSTMLSSFDDEFLQWFSGEVSQDELNLIVRCARVLETELIEFNFVSAGDQRLIESRGCLDRVIDLNGRIRRRSQAPMDLQQRTQSKLSNKDKSLHDSKNDQEFETEVHKQEIQKPKMMVESEPEPSPWNNEYVITVAKNQEEEWADVPIETGREKDGRKVEKITTPRSPVKTKVPGTPQAVDRLLDSLDQPLDKQLAGKKNKKKSKVHTPTSVAENGVPPQTPKRGASAPRQLLATISGSKTPQGPRAVTPRIGEWVQIEDIAFASNLKFQEPRQPLTD